MKTKIYTMKKNLFILFSLAVILLGFTNCSKEDNITLCNWMQAIKGNTPICKITIPATHDSGALLGGAALQCQDIPIREQLENGIRGFDIRLQAEPNQKLGVYHSIQYQNITWEDHVLPDFIAFLKANPSETLVVSVKCENNDGEGYAKLLATSLQDKNNTPYFVNGFRPDITLDECRGKIVFLHRSPIASETYPGTRCIDWKDNDTFDMILRRDDGKEGLASVEDEYFHESAELAPHKAKRTFGNMTAAMNEPSQSMKWFISFASATALPKNGPKDFSDVVNAALVQNMQGVQKNCGIVLIDFAGDKDAKALTKALIDSNQPLHK